MHTILITNDLAIAADAQEAGVSRIMVDLESIGKKERQASRTTFISSHQPEDIARIRAVLTRSELMVRINPIHAGSAQEITHAIAAGAESIMLPMITELAQIDEAVAIIAGRARLIPLMENAYCLAHSAEIAAHPGVAEVYIGLNDLHLSLGLDFLFEPLALGLLDWMVERIKPSGKAFGFGGIAAMGSGELPAEAILAEHVRLGSSRVILSSRFCKDIDITNAAGRLARLQSALASMQEKEHACAMRTAQQMAHEYTHTASMIAGIAHALHAARKIV